MSCHVCSRPSSSRLPFYCSTCARNQLYQLRVDNARILLEKEAIGRQIETALIGENDDDKRRRDDMPAQLEQKRCRRLALQAAHTKEAQCSARTKAILDHIEFLKSEIKEKKGDIVRRKAALAQRQSDAESAKHQLPERRSAMLTSIQNSTKRTEHLWHALHNKTAESRIFLCREAANLYGLRQKVRKKNGETRESYVIGGVTIVDLRDMNSATPAQISTAFSNIAHLLVLVSHYLSLRLPAEITLPHRNYPLPTIFTPAASYLSREVPFPGMSPSQSLSNSPTASRTVDPRPSPRPRPLFIDKSLLRLVKEDPAAYALFLEGASLLAWNVSWLCRTQGLNIGSDSWEDVCDIGKNMWQLLVAPPPQPSTVMRVLSGHDIHSKLKAAKDSPKTTIQRTKSFPMLGHYSHGTSHSFLGASEGTEFMRTWKLPSPMKIVDKLKSTLLGEMASAEWELLEKEWDDEGQEQPQPIVQEHLVLVGPKTEVNGELVEDDTRSTVTARTVQPDNESEASEATRPQPRSGRQKSTSGWTKLKNS